MRFSPPERGIPGEHPAAPGEVSSASQPAAGAQPGLASPGDERTVDDLERFFAALRQVVQTRDERGAPDRRSVESAPAVAASTELELSTEELVAALEADRDMWRERAVVWRERAIGADMLVKALNEHMSDLQVNLDDLRVAMRALGQEPLSDARPELPRQDLGWRRGERELEAGAQG